MNRAVATLSLLVGVALGLCIAAPHAGAQTGADATATGEARPLRVRLSPERSAQAGQSKIIGGEDATPGRWPWIVAIGEGNRTAVSAYCAGTLIAAEWVLTAAHCKVLKGDFVVLGREDLSGNDGEIVQIVDVFDHPDFDSDTFDKDVALLKLEKAVTRVSPVKMIDRDGAAMTRAGFRWIAGWGRLGEADPAVPDMLQEVKVTISNQEGCRNNYDDIGRVVTDNMFCAAGIARRGNGIADACEGDSGGPIISLDTNREDAILLGVISKGAGCARPAYPGVYARLSVLRDWVDGCKDAGRCEVAT